MKAQVIPFLCLLGTGCVACSVDDPSAPGITGVATGVDTSGTGGTPAAGTGGTGGQSEAPAGTAPAGSGAADAEAGGSGVGGGSNAAAGGAGEGGASGGAAEAAAGGMDGAGGSGTANMGGMDGSAAANGDAFVSDVSVDVHEEVRTLLVVTWMQAQAADEVWLEFSFADEDGETLMTSRAQSGEVGPKDDVVLGVPAETDVAVRVVSSQAGQELATMDYQGTTGALPGGMPRPEVIAFDPEIASPDRFMLGAVEDSDSGSYYMHTFWNYIIDRKGRILWYYSEPGSQYITSFSRPARDGEYLWIEQTRHHDDSADKLIKRTLDGQWQEEIDLTELEAGGFTDCIDVTDDGSLLFDQENPGELWELTREGEERMIWSCADHFGDGFNCYTNTVNWSGPERDTVVMSYVNELTVIEVSRATGEVVGQYGEAAGSYAFDPPTWEFGFQHFANITKDGTLLVSSHLPGNSTFNPVANEHAFVEFTIDRENETLIEKWVYTEGPEWPQFKGMALKLPNDNVLANYGTGGVIREVTPDKQTAWHVKWAAEDGDEFYNKMVGHNLLLDDLYTLNGGGPE